MEVGVDGGHPSVGNREGEQQRHKIGKKREEAF
jgi:hypothetical protein